MKTKKITLIILITFSIISFGQNKEIDPIRVFYLGGQSNMDGHGDNKDLPKSLKSDLKNVWIFHGNPAPDESNNGGLGIWEALKPGHGNAFSSDGHKNNLSPQFGIELSFAKKLQELYPNEKIAIIKYSRGGTSIDSLAALNYGCWEPDFRGKKGTRINQYDHFLKTLKEAYKTTDIDHNGKPDTLIPSGIIWMQGESDAVMTEKIALNYYSNLKRLMDLIRASFRVDDLPVVIGKISDSWGNYKDVNNKTNKVWKYGELIQYAQEKFARTDENAAIVRSTRYYKYSDPAHYNSAGYIDLGEKFAESIYQLNKK